MLYTTRCCSLCPESSACTHVSAHPPWIVVSALWTQNGL